MERIAPTMDYSLETSDVLALAKLSWDLYHACYLVARDAPDGFRQLVNELASLQDVLRTFRDDVNTNSSFFDDLEEGRRRIVARCLSSCFDTLNRLDDLISRYQALGIGDRKQMFWQKVKWDTQSGRIAELKSKIMVHSCNISLCMSSMGNSSLERLEQSMTDALEKEYLPSAYEPPQLRDESPGMPLAIRSNRAVESEDGSDNSDPPRAGFPKGAAHRPTMSANWPRHVSTSSESMGSGQSDGSVGGTTPTSPMNSMTKRSISPTMVNQWGMRQDYTFPESRPAVLRQMDGHAAFQGEYENVDRDPSHGDVTDAVTTAMQQLQQARLKEQALRPLRFEPQDKFHKPDAELHKHLESSAFGEWKVRRLTTRDWLLVAVWWLLKARTTLANCEKPSFADARGSLSPSTDSRSTSHQAYVDLMKASYILYDVVLKDENKRANLTDENRKLIADLSEGIKEEIAQFSSVDIPENMSLHSQNLNIWEALQPEENLENSSDAFSSQKSARWITVEQEDAGDEEEKVLFRTFVNAGVGGKKFRMRTKGAPYMLLLSTREGESEPKITICNQSGTLCLQRDFTPEDLAQLIRISNATLSGVPGVKISEPVSLMFDHMGVSLSFQYEPDLVHFINIPKAYFNAVWQRQPIDSDEFSESVIFKSSVEMVEQLKASTMKSMNPPVTHKSCEIRILERSFGDAWRTVRRMAISTSAAEKTPRCIEFFVPLSRVQVLRDEDSRQVLVKWSDTCQERSKTDGNYNPLYSYIYDGNSPNIGLGLHFLSQQNAEDFENAILSLSVEPSFSWVQTSSSGHVYDVMDTGAEQKQYKAVQLYRSRLSWKYCDVFYLYRDVDYDYSHSSLRVGFPRVNFTEYISSHVDQLYRADNLVAFSHCEKKIGQMVADFNDEAVLRGFMSSLTPYDLLFSRRADSLIAKGKSLFGSKKSKKGDTEVQIWRKGNTVQMAARWNDDVPDKWLTMSVNVGRLDPSKDSNQAGFPDVEYSRGTVIDLANIISRSPKTASMARRQGSVTITFKSVRDREEFKEALEGSPYMWDTLGYR